MRRVLVGLLGLVLLVACSSPVGSRLSVEVVPAQETFAPGERAMVLLVNHSEVNIGYGACEPRLERQTAGGWVLVGPEEIPCIGILHVLDARASRKIETTIGAELDTGVYRFRMAILPGTSPPDRKVHSPPFRIQP